LRKNLDVAIRFGELEDSSVVATRIGRAFAYVVAAADTESESFLSSYGLKAARLVMLNARNNETDWDLVSGRKKAPSESQAIASRDYQFGQHFVVPGTGIVLVPTGRSTRKRCTHTAVTKWLPRKSVFAVYSNRNSAFGEVFWRLFSWKSRWAGMKGRLGIAYDSTLVGRKSVVSEGSPIMSGAKLHRFREERIMDHRRFVRTH